MTLSCLNTQHRREKEERGDVTSEIESGKHIVNGIGVRQDLDV